MKFYNHMYDIAFSLDTDVEDPYKVSEKEILSALLRRVATVVEGHPDDAKGVAFDIGGEIGYCDSHEVDG